MNITSKPCRRKGCAFEGRLRSLPSGGYRQMPFCSMACQVVSRRAQEALRTKDAREVAECLRLFDALDARKSPRDIVPNLFPPKADG